MKIVTVDRGDYCHEGDDGDDGGVGCDDEDGDEVSEDGDEVSEDTDGGGVSDDDNNGNYDGNDGDDDDCDDDDLAWSPEFIDHAYKEHLDDNDEESQKKTRCMFI